MTSVNNDNNQKFYQFLQQQGGLEAADSDGNSAITKSEFRQFLENGGFDFSALDGWNGENATKSENDLVNKFWKTINTNTSKSKISGTKVRNSAALDEKEIQTVENRIQASEKLEEHELEIPSFVSDQDGCKKEIKEKLMVLIEKDFIKQGKNIDTLDKFIDDNAPLITNQVACEIYASECIAENMGDLAKEYNYKYGDDKTLKSMIDNLLKKITADTDEAEIQLAIEELVQGYLATAGIGDGEIPEKEVNAPALDGEDSVDGVSANDVWYAPTEKSALNDLQKAVLEKELKAELEAVVKGYGDDYEAYKDLYDQAIADFIAETIKNAKYGDFETTRRAGKVEFEASEIGKKVQKTVQVKKLAISEKVSARIATELSSSLAEHINANRRYLKAMDNIEDKIVEKALNGEYGEPLDENAIVNDILKEVKANVAEFYTNGFGDMDLETLNKTYDVMREAAIAEPNDDKSLAGQRDAAIKYCDTLSKRNDKFKEVVNTVFDGDYKAAINKMMPSEIDKKIADLKAKVLELGDATTFSLDPSTWGTLVSKEGYDLETVRKSAQEYVTNNKIEDILRNKYEKASRAASYTAWDASERLTKAQVAILRINSSQDVQEIIKAVETLKSILVEAGEEAPEWTAPTQQNEVSAIEIRFNTTKTFNIAPKFKDKDGNDITPTSDRITYKSSNSHITVAEDGTVTVNAGSKIGNFDTRIQILVDGVVVGERTIKVVVQDTLDLAGENAEFEGSPISEHINNGHKALQLSGFAHWGDAKTNAKNNINSFVDSLAQALKGAGYTASKVDKAAQTLKNYYNAVIDNIFDNCYSSGSNRNTTISVTYADADGNVKSETTWYNQNTHEREAKAGRTAEGAENISHDSCGIRMNESYAGTNTYEYYINTAVLLNKMQEFYNAI